MRRTIRILAMLVVLLHVAWSLLPMLLRDDLYSEDAAQHTWWLYRLDDPTLFPNDIAADYISQPTLVPVGYQMLMRAAVPLVDAQRFSESLAIVLALLSAWLTWKVGDRVGGLPGAVAGIVVFVALNLPYELHAGGFPRAFGFPLLLGGLVAILDRRWWLVGLVIVIATLFYTPIVMNLGPLAGVMFLLCLPFSRQSRSSQIAFVLLCLIAITIVAVIYSRPIPPEIGPWFTYEQTKAMPEWNQGGRMMFFRPWRVMYFHLSTSGIGLRLPTFGVVVALLAATVIAFRRAIPLTAWVLIGTALAMWLLAHLLLFKLYMPSRYLIYAKPAFAILWAAGLARELFTHFCHSERTCEGSTCPALASISFASALRMTVVLIIALVGSAWFHYRTPEAQPAGFEQALQAIRQLPRDALIAAHPDDADAIPLRTRRSTLANTELSVAMNRGYYAQQRRRLEAIFRMLYASDWQTVRAIADELGVDYFLLDTRRLREPANDYFQPFPALNAPLIERGQREGFALLNAPVGRTVFAQGDVMLIDLRPR